MILKSTSIGFLAIVLLLPFCAKAQDTLSLYSTIYNQIDPVRTFNQEYYYNPANMPDYSDYSFSDIQLRYKTLNKEYYLLQEGKSTQQASFEASSYKTKKNNQTLWGTASYLNTKIKEAKWNNNIDLPRIAPLVMADSTAGKKELQNYYFTGGYANQKGKTTWAAQVSYKAGLSYKTIDPRPKNVTSDLELKVGGNYHLGSKYKAGIYAGINRYIQTSTISFSSEVQQAALYQMNGLGSYNFYFSSRSNRSVYIDFTHYYYLTLGSTDNSFSFSTGISSGTLSKETFLGTGRSSYEINRLEYKTLLVNILKTFSINDHIKIGGKITYNNSTKTGTELFYTNNTDVIQKLLEKDNYQFKNNKLKPQLIVQFATKRFNITLLPFYSQQKTTEQRMDNNAFQTFTYSDFGAQAGYIQQIDSKNMWSFLTNVYLRKVTYAENQNILSANEGINDWITHDFTIKNTSFTAIETSLRYDRKLSHKKSLYAIFAFDLYQFSNNNTNTQTALSLGISF